MKSYVHGICNHRTQLLFRFVFNWNCYFHMVGLTFFIKKIFNNFHRTVSHSNFVILKISIVLITLLEICILSLTNLCSFIIIKTYDKNLIIIFYQLFAVFEFSTCQMIILPYNLSRLYIDIVLTFLVPSDQLVNLRYWNNSNVLKKHRLTLKRNTHCLPQRKETKRDRKTLLSFRNIRFTGFSGYPNCAMNDLWTVLWEW